MFFALFLTFLSVSYDIQNVLRSQCSVVEHEHLFWWNTSNLHSKGWENYLVFVFWMFHQRNKQNKVVMKTTHKGDKYLDFKHVFFTRGFWNAFSTTLRGAKETGSLQTKCLAWSVWIFVDSFFSSFCVLSLWTPNQSKDGVKEIHLNTRPVDWITFFLSLVRVLGTYQNLKLVFTSISFLLF